MTSRNSIKAKRTSMLRRRHDMSKEEFFAHWAGPHADIAKQIPGVSVYTQNRIVTDIWSTPNNSIYHCDGIVELEFQDAQSRIDAGSSDAVSRKLPQDELNFLDAITLCLVDGGVPHVRHGWIKVILGGYLHQGYNAQDLEQFIASSDVQHFSLEKVHEAFGRTSLAVEIKPPQVFATIWFAEEPQLKRFFCSASHWDQKAREIFQLCTVWHVDPLAIVSTMPT